MNPNKRITKIILNFNIYINNVFHNKKYFNRTHWKISFKVNNLRIGSKGMEVLRITKKFNKRFTNLSWFWVATFAVFLHHGQGLVMAHISSQHPSSWRAIHPSTLFTMMVGRHEILILHWSLIIAEVFNFCGFI